MKLTFPEIVSAPSYDYVKYQDLTDTLIWKDCSYIISKECCKTILEKLDNYGGLYNAVTFNGKTLLPKDLHIFMRCHELKDLQERVHAEIAWLCEENYCVPQGCKKIDQRKLDMFKEKLTGKDDVIVDKENPALLTSDIALLTRDEWLSIQVIQMYVDMLNKRNSDVVTVMFLSIQHLSHEENVKRIKKWKNKTMRSCCMILHIQLCNDRHSLVADHKSHISGNHWVCLYYSFEEDIWLYVDSLGFSVPNNLLQQLEPFNTAVHEVYGKKERTKINVHVAHCHIEGKNICTNKCIEGFPFQGTDASICGAASILSGVILTIQSFPSQISKVIASKTLTRVFSWVHELEKYGSFLRRVLILWYLEKKIDLSLINIIDSQVKNQFSFLQLAQ